jgi:hypothetical protein
MRPFVDTRAVWAYFFMFGAAADVAATSSGLLQQWHGNAVLAPGGGCAGHAPNLSLRFSAANPPPTGGCSASANPPSLNLFSTRLDGTLTAPHAGSWEFRIISNGAVRFWVDDHIIVDSSCDTPTVAAEEAAGTDRGRDHPRAGPKCM